MISAESEGGFADGKAKHGDYYSQMFPFKPNMNETSRRMSGGVTADFLTRQKQFIEKQKKHLEEAAGQYRNLASPVKYTYKTPDQDRGAKVQDQDGENAPDSGFPQIQGAPLTSRVSSRAKRGSNGTPMLRRSKTMPLRVTMENEDGIADDEPENTLRMTPKRSHTKVGLTKPTGSVSSERLFQAKMLVDEAVKRGKVFSIIGPYPQIRRAMRKRGWIERFSSRLQAQQRSPRSHSPKRRLGSNDDDDGDDFDDNDGLDDEFDTSVSTLKIGLKFSMFPAHFHARIRACSAS